MRVVFMGSAELSCRAIEALLSEPGMDVVMAVTQPDRPRGRSLKTASCPARSMAESRGLKVISPLDVNQPDVIREIASVKPDFFAVVAYGLILKEKLLNLPAVACINLHTSLLPAYRGAAPIQWAVANGESVSGVSTMYMNEKMDEGDVIYQDPEPISADDTGGTLHDRLAHKGALLLVKTLRDVYTGKAPRLSQDDRLATYAPKLSKKDARIDWRDAAAVLRNRIRAFNPWPVCWFEAGDAFGPAKAGSVRVFSADHVDGSAEPGLVAAAGAHGIDIGTGAGLLRVRELQCEGGRRMKVEEFLRGHSICTGKEVR